MRSLTAAALLLTAAALGGAAPAAGAALMPDQEIAALNGQRALHGLPADIVEVPEWSAGCAAHMGYIRQNGGVLTHDEVPGLPGYSEEGRAAGGNSVLSGTGSSFRADGANEFQQAPIHLMQMLSPFLQRSGAADGCLQTLRDINRPFATSATYSYPGDGGVALASETAAEGPWVPGAFVGLASPTNPGQGLLTGPHLYFYAVKGGAGWYGSLGRITSASLVRDGAGGGPVAIEKVDNQTAGAPGSPLAGQRLGLYLSPGGILIPRAPLAVGASYTASVTFAFSDGSGTLARTWSFTTAARLPLPAVPPTTRTAAVPTPAATPAPTPVPAPVPVPAPTGVPQPAAPVDGSPIGLRAVKLTRHRLSLTASRAAPVWAVIEARRTQGHGRRAKVRWQFREALAIDAPAGVPVSVTHKRLAKGRYRVTLRRGGSKGPVEVVKPTTVR